MWRSVGWSASGCWIDEDRFSYERGRGAGRYVCGKGGGPGVAGREWSVRRERPGPSVMSLPSAGVCRCSRRRQAAAPRSLQLCQACRLCRLSSSRSSRPEGGAVDGQWTEGGVSVWWRGLVLDKAAGDDDVADRWPWLLEGRRTFEHLELQRHVMAAVAYQVHHQRQPCTDHHAHEAITGGSGGEQAPAWFDLRAERTVLCVRLPWEASRVEGG